jgi:hypothetical protein
VDTPDFPRICGGARRARLCVEARRTPADLKPRLGGVRRKKQRSKKYRSDNLSVVT